MRVQWYYHPDELTAHIPSFQSRFCGTQERILSFHFDLVPTISCNGEAEVAEFREDALEQDLPANGFYYRLVYQAKRPRKRSSLKLVTPFTTTCLCQSPYGPNLHVMRWCFKCERWFHRNCLKPGPRTSTSYNQASYGPSSPHALESLDSHETPLLALPPKERAEFTNNVKSLAQQPVARGMHYGVVGNCRYVCRARRLLQQVTAEAETCMIPANWRQYLGPSVGKKLSTEPWKTCPVCGESM